MSTERSLADQSMTILTINVEGLSSVKQEIISDLCKTNNCSVLCLQETHRGLDKNRPRIRGMKLLVERPHDQYGSALFIRDDIQYSDSWYTDTDDIEILSVTIENVTISSIYKPPNVKFQYDDNHAAAKIKITVGDFNSHNVLWGYSETDENGRAVEEWAENNLLSIIHDAKLPKSFCSGRWRQGYNPDLLFVSNGIKENCTKAVLNPLPHSQHRPIMLTIGAVLKPKEVPFRRRFNFKKARWSNLAEELDKAITSLPPNPANYKAFVDITAKISRRHIPRGCRTSYVPGLAPEHKDMYESYAKSYEIDPFSEETVHLGDILTTAIAESRRQTWRNLIVNTDMRRSSKQAWQTLRKLNNDPRQPMEKVKVTANQIAHQLTVNGKPDGKAHRNKIRRVNNESTEFSRLIQMNEIDDAMKTLKTGKAAGIDDIRNEQILHFGPKAKDWLLALFNECLKTRQIPKEWRKSKIIALPKPGKPLDDPKSFRPISLLCCLYKLFERILLNRLTPNIDDQLISEQAGFRPGKSCTAQVLNLTEYIEKGFEGRKTTGVVFVDLSSAYDTVNHRLLLSKVYNFTKDFQLTKIIGCLLSNRRYHVVLGDKRSRWRNQKNGLPQGSVLAPTLFNIYTNDQPAVPETRRFLYADDIAIAAQDTDFHRVEQTLSTALNNLSTYYRANSLRPNPGKTVSCAFHLRNKEANRKLRVMWNQEQIKFSKNPTYLGVTLDRTLSFKEHINKTRGKVATRNNLLQKLTCSKWGADPHTLRTTAMALCYSTAEYAAPVWERSVHAKKIDTALNQTCRIITGCLKPTPVEHLYKLSGIAPPAVRRKIASMSERKKQQEDIRHPLYGQSPPPSRLKSRRSFLRYTEPLEYTKAQTRLSLWKESDDHRNQTLPLEPAEELPPGADQPWPVWRTLNHLRTQTGRCRANMVRWGYAEEPDNCLCGARQTMSHLLVCPDLRSTCSPNDLANATATAIDCAKYWSGVL